MDRLYANMALVVMEDYIKPIVKNLNLIYNLDLTEEYVVSLLERNDMKHVAKSKRVIKPAAKAMFQVREYPDKLDLVKIPNHNRLYLLGKSLAVYVSAQGCYESEDGHSIEEFEYGDEEFKPEGIPNPENELGYTFSARLIAVGSIINKNIMYLTEEDERLCDELGIYRDLTAKIKRAEERSKIVDHANEAQSSLVEAAQPGPGDSNHVHHRSGSYLNAKRPVASAATMQDTVSKRPRIDTEYMQ